MKSRYVPVLVHGICIGVGVSFKAKGVTSSQILCNTLMRTGNDKNDAKKSLEAAELICNALNSYKGK